MDTNEHAGRLTGALPLLLAVLFYGANVDYVKLSGLISAIEEESKLPMPSHSNLARLTAMAFSMFMPLQAATVTSSVVLIEENTSNNHDKNLEKPLKNHVKPIRKRK